MKETKKAFERLVQIMEELREKCPWDRKQTLQSLRKLTIEETYELAEAILDEDMDGIKEELGDILLHIVFYAEIGAEKDAFNLNDVLNGINAKLIRRHPHVFGEKAAKDDEEVKQNWEQLKRKEGDKGKDKTVLSGVPASLPAMVKSNRIQEKVRAVGFDWDKRDQIWDKIKEELDELKVEIREDNVVDAEKEFGDLMFSIINAARLYHIDPESALEKTNRKFIKRFNYLESQTLTKGMSLHDMSLEEMNSIWEEAKTFDNQQDTKL